jgi:hypothetical protein
MEQGRLYQCRCPDCQQSRGSAQEIIHAQMNRFLCTLDERQRRLYAGLESLKMGHGGDRLLALITGLSVKTIAKGRHELVTCPLEERIRQPGAGRPLVEKKRRCPGRRPRTAAERRYPGRSL